MNIYQKSREAAGITQERAAELIDISVESLRAYESGKRIPQSSTVVRMVDIYNTQFLAYQHLKNSDSIACSLLPNITEKGLAEAVLTLIKEIREAESLIPTLIEIASDGVIKDDERNAWNQIKKEFGDVIKSYYCMVVSNQI